MIKLKNNKKKILGIILSLCMILSIVPITAMAEDSSDETITIETENKNMIKFDITAQVTIKDAISGEIIETTSVNKTIDDYIEDDDNGSVKDAKVKEIKDEIAAQFSSRGTVTESGLSSTLKIDYTETRDMNGNIITGFPEGVSKVFTYVYKSYKETYNLTVEQLDPNSDKVINEVTFTYPTTYNIGDTPEAKAVPTDDNQSKYTFYEMWEELEQVDNEWKLVGFWSSDENRLNNCPEDERIKTFKADRKYVYTIIAQPKEGYIFSDKVSDNKYWLEIIYRDITPVGGTDNGNTGNGGNNNSGTNNGSTDNSGANNGGANNGSTDNGGANNGGANNGSTDNSGTNNGNTNNSGSNNVNADNTNNSTDNNTANAGSSNNTASTAAITDNANTSTAPQTSDNMNVILWMTILLACGSVVIGMRAYSSRKENVR